MQDIIGKISRRKFNAFYYIILTECKIENYIIELSYQMVIINLHIKLSKTKTYYCSITIYVNTDDDKNSKISIQNLNFKRQISLFIKFKT